MSTYSIAQAMERMAAKFAEREQNPGPRQVPAEFRPGCLAEFETLGDPVLERMRKGAELFAADIISGTNPRWLTLWGRNGVGNGTGKTFLARLIGRRVWGHLPGAIPAYTLRWGHLCARWQAREDVTQKLGFANDAGLLIIDDAGAENQTQGTVSLLQNLLNGRLGKWTILTTNLSPTEWGERDMRIASRLKRDGAWVIRCETVDYAFRKKS